MSIQDKIRAIQSKLPSIIYFDEACFLRERTSDLNTLCQLIAEIEQIYIEVHDNLQYRVALMIGYLYRIYGLEDANQLEKAQMYFNNCLTYAIQKQDFKKEITTLIRLGEVDKYQNQHESAVVRFHKAIKLCQENEMNQSLDFAYQHLGKCLMEMKHYEDADKYFQLALQIRMEKGNRELINSTQNSLKYNSIYRNLK